MRFTKLVLLVSLSFFPLLAQDCLQTYRFSNVTGTNDLSAPGTSGNFDNRTRSCNSWVFSYTSTGFSALSIQLESATDNSGSPNTFGVYSGTTVSGTNPQTLATFGTFIGTGFVPWLRVNLSTVTGSGSVIVTLYGFRSIPTSSTNSGIVISTANYNFIARTFTSTLTAGTPATVTLTPCPAGVNGTDIYHAIAIGTTGTAEYPVITGGTCTSNATTGTITFTPAYNHSSGWTLGPASYGVQEAFYANAGGIFYTHDIGTEIPFYNTVYVPLNGDTVWFGDGTTTLRAYFINAPLIQVNSGTTAGNATKFEFHHFRVKGDSIGDGVATGDGIYLVNTIGAYIHDTRIYNFDGIGLHASGTAAGAGGSYGLLSLHNQIYDNGLQGIKTDGDLSSADVFINTSVSTNCRVGGTSSCTNHENSATAAYNYSIIASDYESPGAHYYAATGPPVLASNVNISGIVYNFLEIGTYHETPYGANAVNLQLQANVNSSHMVGNTYLRGALILSYSTEANSYHNIGTNIFNKASCAFGGCQNAIWIPYDTGIRNHLKIEPQELGGGSVNNFGSAYVSMSNFFASTVAPSFTGTTGDVSINTTPSAGSNFGWMFNGTAFKPFGYLDVLAPGTGSQLTAAGTITLTNLQHHITGATHVTHINIPTGFKGSVSFICDSAINFDTGDNIGKNFACVTGQRAIAGLDENSANWYLQ